MSTKCHAPSSTALPLVLSYKGLIRAHTVCCGMPWVSRPTVPVSTQTVQALCSFTLVMFPQIKGSRSFRPRLATRSALRDPGCAQELTCTLGPPPSTEAWAQPAPPVSSGHPQVTDKAGSGPLSTLTHETICSSPRGPGNPGQAIRCGGACARRQGSRRAGGRRSAEDLFPLC